MQVILDVMSLEVRVNNKVAQHVYENLGFNMVVNAKLLW